MVFEVLSLGEKIKNSGHKQRRSRLVILGNLGMPGHITLK